MFHGICDLVWAGQLLRLVEPGTGRRGRNRKNTAQLMQLECWTSSYFVNATSASVIHGEGGRAGSPRDDQQAS
jgi:hypothetical protein